MKVKNLNPETFFNSERVPTNRPILREFLWGVDWLKLWSSSVYWGWSVPQGDKSAVIVVPGFMGSENYLLEIYFWLRRIGYQPYFSGIGRNDKCFAELTDLLMQTVEKAHAETGEKVHLVGHSLGGLLARAVAVMQPEKVASVITLGSPIRGVRSHPFVIKQGDKVRAEILQNQKEKNLDCYTAFCKCETVCAMRQFLPAEVVQSAIYTETDGILDSDFCISEDPNRNFKVAGTHVGLIVNAEVYKLVANLLANKEISN